MGGKYRQVSDTGLGSRLARHDTPLPKIETGELSLLAKPTKPGSARLFWRRVKEHRYPLRDQLQTVQKIMALYNRGFAAF
jgi:hypothetical protein